MKYAARIIINDKNTDGTFSHAYLIKLYNLGALITVWIDGTAYLLENIIKEFKNQKRRPL